MKTTGIVRRIDDLGRIVIPKEVRRTLDLKEGAPMEIFVVDGMVCYKELKDLAMIEEMMHKLQGLSENDMYHRIYDKSEEMGSVEFHDMMLKIASEIDYYDKVKFLRAYARWQENDNEFHRRF